MLKTLIFAFSISIDAFGYSFGFGSRKVKLKFADFFALNLLNILILSLFLNIFPYIKFLSEYSYLENLGNVLLLLFGFFYFFGEIKNLFCEKKVDKKIKLKGNNFLNFADLLLLFSIFIIENLFSTIVFFAGLSGMFAFVVFTFLFHCMFFVLGFSLGENFVNKLPINSDFVSGSIFILIALINFITE